MATNVFDLFAKLSLDSSDYDKGLSNAKSAASKLGSGLASAAKLGMKAIGAATTAVVGFGAASVKVGAEFDKSMSQVAATMGVTTDEIQNLRDFAQEMGRTTAFTATQAAEALNYMALAGYDAETSMGMLPNVLNLAAAGTMNLARASDMLTDTQTAFGISLERTTLLVDEMAKAASTGNTSVEQLGDAFLVVGGLAQELNGGFVETANGAMVAVDGTQELEIALTAMANAGIKGSEAGTHMRNMLLKLSSPTDAGTQALEAMGVAVFDTEGKMRSLSDVFGDLSEAMGTMTQEEKIQTISDLFNTRDIASAEALLNAVSQDWDDIGVAILEAKIPLENTIKAIDKGDDIFKKFGADSDEAIEKLAGDIRYDLTTANMSVQEAAQDIADAYDVSMEDAVTAVRRVSVALRDAEGAADQMAKTQLGNLAGDVTLFKSALEGVQIAISDSVSPALRQFVQLGTEGLGQLTTILSSFDPTPYLDEMGRMTEEGAKAQQEFEKNRQQAIEDLFSTITDGVGMIINLLPTAIDAGTKLLSAIGQGIMDNLPTIIDAAIQIITQIGQGLVSAAPQLLDAAIQIVTQLGQALIDNLPTLIPAAVDLINQLTQAILDNIDIIIDGAIQIVMGLADGLLQALPTLLDAWCQIQTKLFLALAENIPEMIPMIIDFITNIGQVLVENAPLLFNAATQLVLALANALIENLPELIPAVIDMILQIVEALTDPNNLAALLEAAVMIVVAIVEGLIKAIPRLLEGVRTIIQNLFDGLALAEEKLKERGQEFIGWLKDGINAKMDEMRQRALEAINRFINGIKERFSSVVDTGRQIITSVRDGISQKIDEAKNWGADLINNFISGLKEKWDNLKNTVSDIAGSIKELLGFSEPEKGPLSNFHTYAPDMMKLFAQGVEDNKQMLLDTVSDAFDFESLITVPTISTRGTAFGESGYEGGFVQNLTINSPRELNPSEIARQTRNANREMVLRLRTV